MNMLKKKQSFKPLWGARWAGKLLWLIALICGGVGCLFLSVRVWELGITLISLAGISWFVGWILRRSLYAEGFLTVTFLAGYVISWCFGFLGYRYLLDPQILRDSPGDHMVITALLVLVATVSTFLGAWLVLRGCFRRPLALRVDVNDRMLLKMLIYFGCLFAVYEAIYLSLVGTNARWNIGNINAIGSVSYIVGGLRGAIFPFYFLLGMSLKERLLAFWNIAIVVVVMGIAGLNALSGGRTVTLEPIAVFMLGVMFSGLSWRCIIYLSGLSLPLVFGIVIMVGMARGISEFSEGGLQGKMEAAKTVLSKGTSYGNAFDDPMYNLMSRLYEPSAQVVIDTVTESGRRVHLVNIERLLFVFVPSFVYPQKAGLSDGNERLVSDYGYTDSDFTSTPMTLIADAYERFGFYGVMGFHLVAGCVLAALGRLVCRFPNHLFILVLLGCFGRAMLLLYPESNLGFFHIVLYSSARDLILIGLLFGLGYMISGASRLCPQDSNKGRVLLRT